MEPDLEMRVDFGFALLASILANSNRDHKRKPQPFTVEEFLPRWGYEEKALPTKTELNVKLRQFAGMMKGMASERNRNTRSKTGG